MPKAVRGGIETFWRVWGDGAPELLLLHCTLAQSGAWNGVAERLGRPALAFDAPGHGLSGPLDPARDYGDQAAAVAESFLGDTPLSVIGHSFGAVTALRLAQRHRRKLRRLVLIEPVLFAAASGRTDFHALLAVFDGFRAAWAAGDRAAATEAFIDAWGTGADWTEMRADQRQAMVERIHIVTAEDPALFDDSARLLAPGRLEALDLPVLLIEGDRSPPIIPAVLDALAARLPAVQRITVPGAGHMAPLTHPGPVAAAIDAFLSRE